MEKVLTNQIIEEVLTNRLPLSNEYQKCSFILPSGKFLIMDEHYEAYKFLVVQGLVQCIPDAEQLLSDLGWVRYSWIGYVTLPDKNLNSTQYKSLEIALMNIANSGRTEISLQLQSNPRFYQNFNLDDIPYIIKRIKLYYKIGKLMP